MNNQTLISTINNYLHQAAVSLASWLDDRLRKVSDTWWEDCVISSLNYNQREKTNNNAYSNLYDFDLATLLRITYRSWYDIQTVTCLPESTREIINGNL